MFRNICFPILNTNILTAKDIEKQINDILLGERFIWFSESSTEFSSSDSWPDMDVITPDETAILVLSNINFSSLIVKKKGQILHTLYNAYDGGKKHIYATEDTYIYRLNYVPKNFNKNLPSYITNGYKEGEKLPIIGRTSVHASTYYESSVMYEAYIPDRIYNKIKPLIDQYFALVNIYYIFTNLKPNNNRDFSPKRRRYA